MELSDFLFGGVTVTPAASTDSDLVDFLRYGVAAEPRRYLGAPFEFFPEGKYTVEVADMRKGCSAGGRPYLAIETLVLESSNPKLPVGGRGQLMYMLDKDAGARAAMKVLRELYQRTEITEQDIRFAVTEQASNLDSSPFAGATLSVKAKPTWGGATTSEVRVWV